MKEPNREVNYLSNYQSKDSDLIDFETIVSTDKEQLAIGPGLLKREWVEDNRKFYHYKMNEKIKFSFAFQSAHFKVKKDKWNDVDLEIYHHNSHNFNNDRIFRGIKASLAYHSKYFSSYQHRNVKVIEFPLTEGTYATMLANTAPFSELRFIMDNRNLNEADIDLPFYISVHELAHKWWGNQVIPANTLGAQFIVESLSELSSLNVLEEEYGLKATRSFLKLNLEQYQKTRKKNNSNEKSLIYTDGSQHVAYRKAGIVLHALSSYVGKETFNEILNKFFQNAKEKKSPYPSSLDLLEILKSNIADSLQYILKDQLETITLYDNRAQMAHSEKREDGKYQTGINFLISKYRTDEKGKRAYADELLKYSSEISEDSINSLLLEDYIEIGLFKGKKELELKKVKIKAIKNSISIITDEKPTEFVIDPYIKLIDMNVKNNRYKIRN
jgi:ABC-2 type transport system permease protein